jgi:heme oxygenase (biliverdin-IX-beta and delta-forming)
MYTSARLRGCEQSLLSESETVKGGTVLLQRLHASTRHWHVFADRFWLELLEGTLTRAGYMTQLSRVYGFVAPFEGACKYTPNMQALLGSHSLTRAGLIAQDLLALGMEPGEVAMVPQCSAITMFRDPAEAVGWLYVVHRSAALHERVERHLRAMLPEVRGACAYLGSVRERWPVFSTLLDRITPKQEVVDSIVASAGAAFAVLQQWLQQTSGESVVNEKQPRELNVDRSVTRTPD